MEAYDADDVFDRSKMGYIEKASGRRLRATRAIDEGVDIAGQIILLLLKISQLYCGRKVLLSY